jgi:hypothetical protein
MQFLYLAYFGNSRNTTVADPGFRMEKKSGSGMNIPEHMSDKFLGLRHLAKLMKLLKLLFAGG